MRRRNDRPPGGPPSAAPALFENHTIARVAGIPIRTNLFLGYLLALWAVYGASRGQAGFTAVLIVLSTVLLLLHELGHAFVARRFGLEVVDIVLWPLGGMARISEMPDDPKVEAWVAGAGPLVNLALAALAAPLLWLPAAPPSKVLPMFGLEVQFGMDPHGIATLFVLINLAYGLLNLLPAFPMDGGRLLRAFLGRGGRSWLAATDTATRIGGVIAWAIILTSLVRGACFMSLIGFFVLWAGLRERWVVRLKHQAAEFSGTRGRFAGWEALLRQAGGERPDAPQGPGHGLGGHGLGGLGTDAAGAGPVEADPAGPNVGARGRGFTDEDIERLESFRGRLQKPNPADEGS